MLIGLNTFRENRALVHGKGLKELKKMSIRLQKRVCELQRFVATRRACWRRPSYSVELTVVCLRLNKVNRLIDVISGYDEEKSMESSVERFIEAQERNYGQALAELRNGKKTSHWMWYVFPQLRFLGHSDTAYYYGIADEQEAKEYCANTVLYDRYIECCRALESVQDSNPERVMGSIDALKLCSSLTLFYMVDEKNKALYEKLIDKFYHGRWDRSTMDYLIRRRTVNMKLNDAPYQQIIKGEKTVEVRLYDEKRSKIQEGNRICFTHSENEKMQIEARVVALHRYNSFKELFENVGLDSCGFKGYSVDEAVEAMKKYYTPEEESKYGVVGIEIILGKDWWENKNGT